MRFTASCIAAVAAALLTISSTPAAFGAAAAVAAPSPPKPPTKPLHADLQVEVNKLGQVVRVPHGNLSGDRSFDMMAIGNALQMWIREEKNGKITALVGLYRVDYDYDPSTQKVKRGVHLIKAGGKWANETGAAAAMIANAQRTAKAALEKLRKQHEDAQSKNLPDINGIVKQSLKPTPKPTSHP